MKLNAEQYSEDGKAYVRYYRLFLYTYTEFSLQLVELNYASRLGLDNLKTNKQTAFTLKRTSLLFIEMTMTLPS